MQEIVNFLFSNPEVVEKLVNKEASLLGVELDEVLGLLEAFSGAGRTVAGFWW